VPTFSSVLVYDNLGTAVRLLRNGRANVYEQGTTTVAAGLTQGGVSVTSITSDANGLATFVATSNYVDLVSPNGLRQTVIAPSTLVAAAAMSVNSDAQTATNITTGGSNTDVALKARYPVKAGVPRSFADYGVLPGNTAAQNRAGFAAAQASGYLDWILPEGTYQYSAAAEGNWAMTFTNQKRIRIRGLNAVINDTTTFTNNGAFTGLFLLDGCKDVEISGVEYVGPVLGAPGTDLGYTGATVTRAINATDGVKVDMRITNARYGVQTGDYADSTKGLCKNFDLRLRTSFCGYPVAAYLASGLHLDIDADSVHRAAYIAGCDGVTGMVQWKNNYIASVAVLITDVLTSGTDAVAQVAPPANPTTSKGSSNVDLTVIEKGSTTFVAESYLAGISLSRVDPGIAYRNINIRVYSTATDSVSTTLHGFIINSTANAIWSRYTNNWESTILLENIKIGGVIDKSATTAVLGAGSNGPITIRSDDPAATTHFGTIRNLVIEDMLIKRGTQTYVARIFVRGLASPMVINRLVGPDAAGTPALYVSLVGNTTQPIVLNDSTFATLDMSVVTNMLVVLGPGTAITAPDADRQVYTTGGTLRGAGPRRVVKLITTAALSGANQTLTGAIPAGAVDVRIQARVTTLITGASGFQIGVSGDLTRYADITGVSAGTLAQPVNHAASAFTNTGSYSAATDLVITAKTSNFTAGVIRLAISYTEFPSVAN
jgi:hypothetical protein